jgi:hypothetical protein
MSRADSPLHGCMIFNVGARRSGTHWLQRIVTAHPEVAGVPSETHLFSHGIAPLFELFQHSLRSSTTTGRVYVERAAALDGARDLCDAVLGGFVEPGVPRLAERTPLHAQHLELIAEIYPDAQFIHIIRDGRDVARSIVAQAWGPSEIREAAAEWRSAIVAAREARLPPSRYREVRYERLVAEPGPIARELYSWLGLRTDEDVLVAAADEASVPANLGSDPSGVAVEKWREAYSDADLQDFYDVAGDLLEELGYTRDGSGSGATPAGQSPPAGQRKPASRLAAAAHRLTMLPRRRTRDVAGYDQPLVDDVLGAMREADVERLQTLLDRNALVRVASPEGSRSGRGRRGLDLLADALAGVPLDGRQTLGDAYPGSPYAGTVLAFEGEDTTTTLVVFLRLRDGRVGEMIVYLLSDA